MPWYNLPGGGTVHLNFGRKGNKNAPAPCCKCGCISSRLCDWKLDIGGPECDAPICESCTWSPAPDKDLCPRHVQVYRGMLQLLCIPLQ